MQRNEEGSVQGRLHGGGDNQAENSAIQRAKGKTLQADIAANTKGLR